MGWRQDLHYRRAFVVLALSCVLLTTLLAATGGTAFPQDSDPIAEAEKSVAEAQAQVDQIAGAYFDALERARELDARISDRQQRTDEFRDRVTELKKVASDRAIGAYKRSGNSLERLVFDTADATDVARRVKLFDLLNARDDEAVRALRRSEDDLAREIRELEAAREQQSRALGRLEEREQQVNAKLVAAQNERQVVVEQQLQAQQQAAAAAAAEAAARPPADPAPSTTQAPPTSEPPPSSAPGNATPTPVPGTYAPTGGVNPHHDDPYLTCVRRYESSGNYQAFNPGGSAYGAYQFLQSTWNLTANHVGRGNLVGLDPRRASAYDQDQMAWDLYQWQGKRPWSVDPC